MAKNTIPVPVCVPSETVSSTPMRPDCAGPAWKVRRPSTRAEMRASSPLHGAADSSVNGSPSGSVNDSRAFMV